MRPTAITLLVALQVAAVSFQSTHAQTTEIGESSSVGVTANPVARADGSASSFTGSSGQMAVGMTGSVLGSTTKAVVDNVIEQVKHEGVDNVDLDEAMGSVQKPEFVRSVVVGTTLGQATSLAAANAVQGLGPAGPLVKAALAATVSTVGTDMVDGQGKKDWAKVVFTTSAGILATTLLTSSMPVWASVVTGIAVGVAADELYDWAKLEVRRLLQPRPARSSRPGVANADSTFDVPHVRPAMGTTVAGISILGVEGAAPPRP